MYTVKFYAEVVRALDEIGVPYMIVGAFAGLSFGITRTTFDIDILVDLHDQDFEALSARFPLPRYYADPEMMQNSTQMGIMFNIIDSQEGIKADLVPLKREDKQASKINNPCGGYPCAYVTFQIQPSKGYDRHLERRPPCMSRIIVKSPSNPAVPMG